MKKILIALCVAALVVGVWFWIKSRLPAAAEEEPKPVAKVETFALADQPIAQTIEAFGTVVSSPAGERVIAAPYDCIVRKVPVSVGATVAAGDVLLELDPGPDVKLAADSARSMLRLALGALAATQQRYDLKLANSQELLAARQAAEDAQLKVDSFAARGLGGDGRVVAGEAGVVTRLELASGTLVTAGTPLATISIGGRLEARLGVEVADAAAVAPGQNVSLESSNRPAGMERVTGTIRSIGAALDATTGADEARVTLPSSSPLLFGEHVRALIEVRHHEHALVVPRSAVLPDDDKRIIFTVKDCRAVRHEVKIGIVSDGLVEVIGEGLHAGDAVVTLGNYELEDGMAIQAPEKPEKETKPQAEAKS